MYTLVCSCYFLLLDKRWDWTKMFNGFELSFWTGSNDFKFLAFGESCGSFFYCPTIELHSSDSDITELFWGVAPKKKNKLLLSEIRNLNVSLKYKNKKRNARCNPRTVSLGKSHRVTNTCFSFSNGRRRCGSIHTLAVLLNQAPIFYHSEFSFLFCSASRHLFLWIWNAQ